MSKTMSIEELAALAAAQEDQTEVKKGGDFVRAVVPEGPNFFRLIEYIETGKQPQKPWQGKPKPDAPMVRITFELGHKDKMNTYEVEGQKITKGFLFTLNLQKSLTEKSLYRKLFEKMRYGRDNIKHMAQMLNEVFYGEIFHNKETKDGREVTYININKKGEEYTIKSPFFRHPVTEETIDLRPNCMPATYPLRLFLFDNPTKETWDSLFIEGTRKVKQGDVEIEESKNWLQELILNASNYPGSALDQLLHGVADLPLGVQSATADKATVAGTTGVVDTVELDPSEVNTGSSSTKASAASGAAEKPAGAVAAKPATSTAEADAAASLAALGLV
jgi:hypothetical protein